MPELLGRLQSALADRYRLDREVGAGGMATVYLAEDVRHDRRVALKVLRPELAAVIGAERFLAEIKLTANLQHPHILPLFDSGEADGYLFYVMPFVEGETLRDRLNREKQLPVADAVRITTEVASALDYAHRHGVIHRDIKPENILLHDGQALVADFGIALAASKAGGARMTETGMSLGTPHYMSPEQAMGEREITARSDVYALGAVLYEMLTGEPPFTGRDGAGGGGPGGDRDAAAARCRSATPSRATSRRRCSRRSRSSPPTGSRPRPSSPRRSGTRRTRRRVRGAGGRRRRGGARRPCGRRGPGVLRARRSAWRAAAIGGGALGLAPPGAGAAPEPVQPRAQAEPGAAAAQRQRRRPASRSRADGRALAYIGPARGRHPPLAPAPRPARRHADRRHRRRLEPVLLARRPPGRVHQERHRGADRVARRARRRSP